MAALLVMGAIPSGLASIVHSVHGLYIVRFFIGILGGTFVPCQAWTTVFFDKKVVGRANSLVGGWGNSGGGFTFIIMIALFNQLVRDGHSSHTAWRLAFVIVPVPVLLFTATLVLYFGTDHPAGNWADRHTMRMTAEQRSEPEHFLSDSARSSAITDKNMCSDEENQHPEKKLTVNGVYVSVIPVSELETAVNTSLSAHDAVTILLKSLTWLPAFSYLTTFGFELTVEAALANVIFGLYKSSGFNQTKAGYVASVFGLLNIFTRPLGGYVGDVIYRRFGVSGKKYAMVSCGALQGLFAIGLGIYIDRGNPSLSVLIALLVLLALFLEAGNGVNFSLVPHCNPNHNGFMSGFVGGFGNLGGILFSLVFRFQPMPIGMAFWICGTLSVGINALLTFIPVPTR